MSQRRTVERSTTARTPGHGGHRRSGPAVLRGLGVLAVLAVWLVVAAFGGMAQGTLSEVQENDNAAFLPAGAESTRAAELAGEFTDTSSLPALVVLRPLGGGPVAPDEIEAAQRLAADIGRIDLPDGRVMADVLAGPVVAVPAEDGEAVLVPVPVDAELAQELVGEEEDRLVNVVVELLRAEAESLPDGLESWVTGPAGAIADLVTAFGGIDGILLAVALVVVLVILVAVYRSPSLPFTVLLTAVFALTAAALVIKPLAAEGVLLLNGQSQGILSILVVGAATDYSLLLVARYREELVRHRSPYRAMARAWRASLEPILASAGTVIVGLLTLLLSDLGSNASLGPVAAIGIVASVLAAMTLLPALLLVAGSRARFIFWPRIPHYRGGTARPDDAAPTGLWARVADAVTRRPRRVWVTTAVVLVALSAFVPTFRASGTSETDIFLDRTESVVGQEVLAEHFGSGQAQPAFVVTSESAWVAVREAAAGVPGISEVSATTAGGPPAGVAADGPPPGAAESAEGAEGAPPAATEEGAGEPLVVDGRVRLEAVTEAAFDSIEAQDTVADLREAVRAADPDAVVGGATAERLDTQLTAQQDLRTIIPVILVAIFVMLVLLLRAVVAPLVILGANILSFGATMGVSAVVFNHVLGFPGADATVPLYGFVFLVALGIDYSIFLMTRVREESLVVGTRDGVRRGLAVTGGVITSAGLVLAATFSALAVIPLLFLVQLAFIVGFGVLIDTFVVRSLLVPGAVHDLGRRAWWPWAARVPADAPRRPAN